MRFRGSGCVAGLALALAVAGSNAACGGRPEESEAAGQNGDPTRSVQVRLDSAASAYRLGDMAGARDHFAQAASSDSTLAAAWFGLFMTEHALGNMAVADSALRRARALASPTEQD